MATFGAEHALLVVDMQNDFLLPTSPVCVKDGMACLPRVIDAVNEARACGVPVIWIVRGHHNSGQDVEITRHKLFTDGAGVCVLGSDGAALAKGLTPHSHEIVITKQRFSAFMATELDLVLRRLGVQRLTVVGVQTPNCIRATAFDAVALGYHPVMVLRDATASESEVVQDANLYDLGRIGVATPGVEEWAIGLIAEAAAKEAI